MSDNPARNAWGSMLPAASPSGFGRHTENGHEFHLWANGWSLGTGCAPDGFAPTDDDGVPIAFQTLAACVAHYAPERRTGTDRRTGDDRRAPVPSPTGDRWRNVADSLAALADASADAAAYGIDHATRAYGQGQEDAYRAAARIVRALADTEDIR